jgi:antitoxin HigA-1
MTTPHPGEVLKKKFLDPLGISAYRLSSDLGVHVSRISQLIQGNRALTADTAMRLSLYFGVPAKWWTDLQTAHDLDDLTRVEELRQVVKPFERPRGVGIGPQGVRIYAAGTEDGAGASEVVVDREMMVRLRAQASVGLAPKERSVEAKDYGRGYRAITGAGS